MKEKLFVIRGEDMRNIHLARQLIKDGYNVALWDYPVLYQDIPTIDATQLKASPCILILSLATTDSEMMFAISTICSGSIVFGGSICIEALNDAKEKKISYHNLLTYEMFSVLNAIPTAEGALMTIMQNTPYTVHGLKVLILGYGRVGKATAGILKNVGAMVTVASSDAEELSWARVFGHKHILLKDLKKHIWEFDVVVNTIPAKILDKNIMENMNPQILIVELASGVENIDSDDAKDLSINVVIAHSLPGKVAPASAGAYIKNTIYFELGE